MTAMTEALARIQAAGIRLEVRDGKLRFQGPPDAMTTERTAWLARHKAELVELLSQPARTDRTTAGNRTAVLTCAEDPGDVTPEMVQAAIACAMLETGIRGPCIRCGEPVTWSNGLRDWFAELVHITCPAPAPETAREPVGTCPHCRFTVFADNAVQTGAGVFMHAVCARAGR
jgi:hypothetical protein